jgi:hypothetical protein
VKSAFEQAHILVTNTQPVELIGGALAQVSAIPPQIP